MGKTVILLSALTCLSGGWALMDPAEAQSRYPSCEAQSRYPSCEALVNTSCAGPNPAYQYCTRASGQLDILYCFPDSGYWVWA